MDLSGYVLERLREDSEVAVYRGRHPQNPTSVLLLAPASRAVEATILGRLEHELALAAQLDPAWAVKPLALARHEGRATLVLDDPGGQPLDRRLGQPMELAQFLETAVGLASAVRQAHAEGLIHKDIKPANIFIDETGLVRLTGFGFATRLPRERQAPARPEGIAGSLPYMAPEQTGRTNRAIDNRSDLYALGVTLYEMLVGAPPFTASDPLEWIYCHIARLPPPPGVRVEGVPPTLEAVVLKLLAKNAEDRYQTAAGLEYDLRRCREELQSLGRVGPFPLAERDLPDRLIIPEKLYGREAELGVLTAAFEQVANNGRFEFVLVSGYSGVGKSSIVDELHRSLYPTRALYAAGKFDQYKRNIPYATLADAFHGLVRHILGQDDVELDRWRGALAKALGANGQLMVDLFPELSLVLGDQPPLPSVSPHEAKNRFQLTFRRFISVFTQPEHPLVLFLDDLQWLDTATLDLLELLAADEGVPNLLLIGAYRSNELDSSHRIGRALEAIGIARGGLHEIRLAPLGEADVGALVADALHAEPAAVAPLANLVFQKTQGNPFFAIQFLTTLNVEGLLAFDALAGFWAWDLERIRAKGITDNVADLMAGKLARYEGAPLAAIMQLACLGDSARTATLSKLLGESETYVDAVLREAVGAGLIDRVEGGYAFAHDGVREAAYALIPEDYRAPAHLKIGRLLLDSIGPRETDDAVFEIANQLNRGASLIRSRKERHRLAELNLIAGKRAKAATAYDSAIAYLSAGCALLGPKGWDRNYRTLFDLEFHQADCKFMIGDTAFAEERLAILSERSESLSDRALVISRQIHLYHNSGRVDRSMELALGFLARMGVIVPVNASPEDVERDWLVLRASIGDRAVEDLADLPSMTDPHWLQVMDTMAALLAPAALVSDDLHHLIILRMVQITLDRGLAHESAHCFACFGGLIMGWRFDTFETGHSFGRLAMQLVDERGFDRYAARVYAVISGLGGPWHLPLRTCQEIANRSVELGREQGGITYSGNALHLVIVAALAGGRPLAEVQHQCESALGFTQKNEFTLVTGYLTAPLRLTLALRGLTPTLASFDGDHFSDDEFERQLEGSPYLWHGLVRYKIRKLQLKLLAGDLLGCLDIISRLEGGLSALRVFEIAEYRFFSALARAAMLADPLFNDQATHRTVLASNHAQIVEWARLCPANFADRAALVGAEVARLEGRELDAEHLYEQAIRLSRDQGFVQNEALSYELAARFYTGRGFEMIAETYLLNARACYLRWGADGKVRQLDRLYPHLSAESRRAVIGANAPRLQHLDLAAVVEMYQAVSREIVLERLIERLMVTVVEHAGAVRGLLLLPREGELRVVAQAVAASEAVTVTLGSWSGGSPQSILNFVARAQDIVIIDDALEQNPYSADPYISRTRPRSLLCLPLVKQKRLVGVLYLENNLSSHIFTPDRLSVLQLLASQAAISIENAELFRDIQEAQNEARRVGEELQRSFDMMPALAWRASADGTIEFANKQWHDYTGIAPDDPKLSELWLSSFHPDDAEKVADRWRHLFEFRTSGEVEARMRRFDGEFRRFLVRATPMRDDQGKIVKWHGTNTDIEELKRAEQAQEALARVSRLTAMGELTVSIAHEVNQPLMAIVTNAATCLRFLADEQINIEEARRAAERIIRAGHRAGDVIASIRAMARKSPAERTALDLNDVILEVLQLARNELDRHAIVVDTDLDAGAGFAIGDRVQMQQVVLNLVMNGIEAIVASENSIRRLQICTEVSEPGFIQVSVADSGRGLDPADAERIFEAFFTTKPDGVGMGLSICRSIVEVHGGRLSVSPNPSRGCVFRFSVPTFVEERSIARVH